MYLLKYKSLFKIHPEYKRQIEKMLSHEVPDFSWLTDQPLPESGDWSFLLFISKETNRAVGFASLCLKGRSLVACLPLDSGLGRGIFFEPEYQRKCQDKLIEQIEKLKIDINDSDLKVQLLSGHRGFGAPFRKNKKSLEGKRSILFRLEEDYPSYLKKLKMQDRVRILNLWKELNSSRDIKIGDYNSLDELLKQKKISLANYMKFRNHPKFFKYTSRKSHYLVFEVKQKVVAMTTLVEGRNKNLFFDLIIPPEGSNISYELMVQYAVLKFLEMPKFKKLIALKEVKGELSLKASGFFELSTYEYSLEEREDVKSQVRLAENIINSQHH